MTLISNHILLDMLKSIKNKMNPDKYGEKPAAKIDANSTLVCHFEANAEDMV